jgi:hypothetical protein
VSFQPPSLINATKSLRELTRLRRAKKKQAALAKKAKRRREKFARRASADDLRAEQRAYAYAHRHGEAE